MQCVNVNVNELICWIKFHNIKQDKNAHQLHWFCLEVDNNDLGDK